MSETVLFEFLCWFEWSHGEPEWEVCSVAIDKTEFMIP